MIKKIVVFFFFLGIISTFGQQKDMNNYKYIIVPEKFDFLKESNQYQTSSLTKFLLQKNGFTVFFDKEKLPSDLTKNRCLGLTANLSSPSTMFITKAIIVLKDCYGKEVYSSKVGKSKLKDYKKSYHEAIRNAHATMNLNYSYQPKVENKDLSEEVKVVVSVPVKKDVPVTTVNIVKDTSITKTASKGEINRVLGEGGVLYAQPIENGFQLVNTKPEVIFQILNTNNKDLFIIKDKNGILYKSKDNWISEYYENNVLVVKKYLIKF